MNAEILTYRDLLKEARTKISAEIIDYRPASGIFIPGMDEDEEIQCAIVCWLKDGAKIVYIKERR